MAPTVRALVERGIPVVGHLGLTPQSVHALGGYKVQGREQDARPSGCVHDAPALEAAGASLLVLELVPAALATRVSTALRDSHHRHRRRPRLRRTGARAATTCSDSTSDFNPKFLRKYADLGGAVQGGRGALRGRRAGREVSRQGTQLRVTRRDHAPSRHDRTRHHTRAQGMGPRRQGARPAHRPGAHDGGPARGPPRAGGCRAAGSRRRCS